MPVTGDIDFYRGDDRVLELYAPSSDMTTWTTEMIVKDMDGDTQITKAGVFVDSTHVSFQVDSADTLSMDVGPYDYEMARTDVGHVTSLRIGRFNLLQRRVV